VTLDFDGFNPGVSSSSLSLNCQIHLGLKYPESHAFAVADTTQYGWYMLPAGTTLAFQFTYYFSSDASHTVTTKSTLTGGGIWADGQLYRNTTTIPTAQRIWSSCGSDGTSKRLSIYARKSMASPDPNVDIGGYESEIPIITYVGLQWKRC
jgi:hypothetical protein